MFGVTKLHVNSSFSFQFPNYIVQKNGLSCLIPNFLIPNKMSCGEMSSQVFFNDILMFDVDIDF